MDAGGPPVQAVDCLAPDGGRHRPLPDLRDRRRAGALTRGLPPPTVVPAESPTLGLSHLQFDALLSAARESGNRNDFALVTMLGQLRLRIFEACGRDVADVGEEHGHRVLRVVGKGTKIVLVPFLQRSGAIDHAMGDRPSGPILLNLRGRRMDRLRHPPAAATGRAVGGAAPADAPAHAAPHLRDHDARRRRDAQIAARHADPHTTMRYAQARKNLDRHPNQILAPTWHPVPDHTHLLIGRRCTAERGSCRRTTSGTET